MRQFGIGESLNLDQRFAIQNLTFSKLTEIQKLFNDLGRQVASDFKPTPEQLAEWEEANKGRRFY